ncbi:unnamed protein product [Linum tenue]|nr:unnamed protein product [Linum tenue]
MLAHYKTEMWDLVQEKFDIDPLVEPWIMSSLDSKWRNFKNKVKNRWFGKKERDGRVLNDDWTWLLEFWSSNKAVRREIVAKENRSKVKSAHTLGTKSYACKRDEMAESTPDKVEPTPAKVYVVAHVRKNGTPLNAQVAQVIEKINEPSCHDNPGSHDRLSQALGEDKYNPSRTYGLGASLGVKNSRVSIIKKALEAQRNAEEKAEKVQEELHEVREGQQRIMSLLQKLHPSMSINEMLDSTNQVTPNDILNTYLPHHQGLSSKTGTTVARNNSSQMVQNRNFSFLDYALDSSQNVDSSSQQRTEQVSSAAAIGHESQELEFVMIKSLLSPGVDVAYANILTKDPKGRVAGQELGRGFYEVFVQVGIHSDEPLVRPYGSYQTIGDVIGRSIAWPSSLSVDGGVVSAIESGSATARGSFAAQSGSVSTIESGQNEVEQNFGTELTFPAACCGIPAVAVILGCCKVEQNFGRLRSCGGGGGGGWHWGIGEWEVRDDAWAGIVGESELGDAERTER